MVMAGGGQLNGWIDGNTESLNETVDLIFSDNFANVL